MSRSKPLSSLLLTGNVVIFVLSIHCCHAWISAPQSSTRPLSNLQKSTTDLNSSIPKFKRSRVLVHESPDGESTRASTITTPTSTEESIPSSKKSANDNKMNYNWQKQWYSVTFSSYVPNPSTSAEVTPASIFGHPLVLWRSSDDGPIHCADDVCPHRAAALSEGRLRDGKLECYYHGWQFDGDNDGACNFIPQLEKEAQIPKAACLKMRTCRVVEGIVWVWMGKYGEEPTMDPPIQGDGLDPITGQKEGYIVNDFQIDLPYDHSYLVENLIDPAHIPISHDRTPGGGKRENAQAYEMVVDSNSINAAGFTGRYRTVMQQSNNDPFIEVTYEAPGIIRQKGMPRGKDSPFRFGAALHCMPLTLGRSRLLFRTYFTGLPPLLKFLIMAKPTFLRNLNSCKILEQDAGLITTQEDYFKRTKHTLKEDYILLSTSDVFVKAYRQWLDKVGHGMPWFQGLASRSSNVDNHLMEYVSPPAMDPMFHRAGNHLETRYHRHVMHCPTTRKALGRVQKLKKSMMALAVASVTLSCGAMASLGLSSVNGLTPLQKVMSKMLRFMVPLIPLSSLAAAGLYRLEQRFFLSFKRKDQMRTESGL